MVDKVACDKWKDDMADQITLISFASESPEEIL